MTAFWLTLLMALASARAESEATADTAAETKAGYPAPEYSPAPYSPYTPYEAYGYESKAYTPAPHYGPHYPSPKPYHTPYPKHEPYKPDPYHKPEPYKPDPYYKPEPYHKSEPYHKPEPYHKAESYGPPKCAHGNPKPYCLEDPEYPTYEIEAAIEHNYDAVQQLYKDVLANTANSVDRLHELVEETYLCPSKTDYIQPSRAINVHGKWRIIVNHVKAHYETLTQTARVEYCEHPGAPCPLVPECYETKCLQKSIYHRFLIYDPYDKYLPFAIESFKLPASCACYNGAFQPSH